MRFNEFNEAMEPGHKAAIKGMHRLSGDQYYGLYKTMNDVAGHDGKKQTAPSGGTDDEVSDKPFAYAYTDEEEKMLKAVDPKAKRITSSKSEEVKEGVAEGSGLDKFRQRVNSQGFTDSPEERNADRLERKRRHQDALNRISDIGGGSSDEERAHQAQQRMARDEYKLDRLKRNDDDWENTFDMMRDRMNRYQWSSQRDVDPEQLAAISNIKYEPRKKNEDVQAKTDDKLLAYYAQRKAEKEKQGLAKGGQVYGQPQWQRPSTPLRNPMPMTFTTPYHPEPGHALSKSEVLGPDGLVYNRMDPRLKLAKPTQGVAEAGRSYDDNRTGFSRGPRDDERHDLDVPRPTIYALKINGKIWQKDGNVVTFFTKERALAARNSILNKRPELEVGLVQRQD